jgi:hypothetical protein
VARASDTSDLWAPDSWLPGAWAADSGASQLSLERAIGFFLAGKAAEGASPKTIVWYRMVLGRVARDLGSDRTLDSLTSTELREWVLTLRETLAPVSVAGYVRGLKVFGNWCAAEELAEAKALRSLRRSRVPHKLVEPLSDEDLRRLLDAPHCVIGRSFCCSWTPACASRSPAGLFVNLRPQCPGTTAHSGGAILGLRGHTARDGYDCYYGPFTWGWPASQRSRS